MTSKPILISLNYAVSKLPLAKVGALDWYSVKIGVIFCVLFERWKVDKKPSLH